MTTTEKNISDYIAVLRRRRKQLFYTMAVVAALSVAIAFGLPAVYESKATILIEQQQIPQDLVPTTVTTYATQQIQTISQRVMTTSNLNQIIKKFDLYADRRAREPLEQVIDDMRDDIKLDTVSADVVDPKTGRPSQATIAFTLAYDNKSPTLAQKVANELVSLYLSENTQSRTEAATQTSTFLTDETAKLKARVDELDSKLAAFKEQNLGKLPEMMNINMDLMARTERDKTDTDSQLSSLMERKTYLEGQLAQISPKTRLFDEKGIRILGPKDRLSQLKIQYAAALAKYSPEHPDVISLKRQIEALQKEVGEPPSRSDMQAQLQQLRSDLAEAKRKYSPEHPDVKRLERDVSNLENELAKIPADDRKVVDAADADNPAYVQLRAELESIKSQIQSVRNKKDDLDKRIQQYRDQIADGPKVERQYNDLLRDYNLAQAKYQDMASKQMAAQVSQTLEKERKGEHFTLPSEPNRVAILLLGLMFSFAGGIGSVAVTESMDDTIYGRRAVTELLGVAPLAAIPYIGTVAETRQRALARALIISGVILVLALALIGVHLFVQPLDVLWYASLQRLGLSQ